MFFKNPRTVGVIVAIVVSHVSMCGAGMEPGTFKPEVNGYYYYHHEIGKESNSFDFSRMYIGVKYQVSEEFLVRYLTDIAHSGDTGTFEAFTKYAYLDWTLGQSGTHLIMGLQGTNNWSAPEKAWGYRSIRYSPMENFGKHFGNQMRVYEELLQEWADFEDTAAAGNAALAAQIANQKSNIHTGGSTRMGSSADLGAAIKFTPTDRHYISLMVLNGVGYNKAENDMYKNLQVRAGAYFLKKALHVSAYAEVEPWKGVDNSGAARRYMNFQWDLMVSYRQEDVFQITADVNSKTLPGDFEDITALCFSGYGNVYLIKEKLKALARFDMYQTGFNDSRLDPAMESNANFFVAGLDYLAHKNVHIIPNMQILSFEAEGTDSEKDFYIHVEFKF